MKSDKPMRVIGYVRVSTSKQDIGPEVQMLDLDMEAHAQGWQLEIRREDAASAKSLKGRPVLAAALADLRAGRADMLAVSKLDRLSRSVADFAQLLDDSHRQGWHIACLDLDVDTTTVTGRAMAQVTAVFAEMERRRIGERTRDAMARIKAEHPERHLGRPATLAPATVARVHALRAEGHTLRGICDALTAEVVPTATGGKWWPGTVRQVLARPERAIA